MTPFHLTYGLTTNKGSIRETNQDAAAARLFGDNEAGLFIVADGYGEDEAGKNAAQIAIGIVSDAVVMQVVKPTTDGDSLDYCTILTEAFQKANRTILQVQSGDNYGSTTLTSALIIGEMLFIAHVGDTRLSLVTDDEAIQLTEDHSGLSAILRLELFTWEEYISGRAGVVENRLYRTIGDFEQLEVDVIARNLGPESTILICTDGLHGWNPHYIKDPELQTILQNNDPKTASDKLVTLARERGSIDDITALVVRVA